MSFPRALAQIEVQTVLSKTQSLLTDAISYNNLKGYQLPLDYLMPKFGSFANVWLWLKLFIISKFHCTVFFVLIIIFGSELYSFKTYYYRIYRKVDFAVSADHKVYKKEREERDKY